MTEEELRLLITKTIQDHVKDMFQYTLPDLGQIAGYTHALNLVERDSVFIAAKIVAALEDVG